MKRKILLVQIILLLLSLPIILAAQEKEPKSSQEGLPMVNIYKSFIKLQSFISHSNQDSLKDNKDEAIELVRDIYNNFHDSNSLTKQYGELPGFKSNLTTISSSLKDALWGLERDKTAWALWQLKAVSKNCQTCHTSYKVKISFNDPNFNLKGLSHFEKAELLLASRQYPKAQIEYIEAIKGKDSINSNRGMALRRWLDISIRVEQDASKSLLNLEKIRKEVSFAPYETEEIDRWIRSLKKWAQDGGKPVSSLVEAKKLLETLLKSAMPLYADLDAVTLLRVSTGLHSILEKRELASNDKSEALYLLGLIYTKLPLFFIDELPELFLEQCVREFSNTEQARQAYRLYKEHLTMHYTGSGGAHIPAEVLLKFDELYRLSHGIKRFEDRI